VLAAEPGGGAGSGDGASPPPLPPVGGTTAITDTPRRPTRDLVAIGLVGGGVAAEVAAIVIYTRARSAQCGDPVCNGVTYDAYLAAEDRARSLRLTSIIVAGVGGALLAGGAVRYLTHARRREPTVGLVPTRGGGTLVLGGRF
jgi:hypothetical protein